MTVADFITNDRTEFFLQSFCQHEKEVFGNTKAKNLYKLVSYLGFTSNDLGRRAVTFQDDFIISYNIQPNYVLKL